MSTIEEVCLHKELLKTIMIGNVIYCEVLISLFIIIKAKRLINNRHMGICTPFQKILSLL